jgi:hypothetical protein
VDSPAVIALEFSILTAMAVDATETRGTVQQRSEGSLDVVLTGIDQFATKGVSWWQIWWQIGG